MTVLLKLRFDGLQAQRRDPGFRAQAMETRISTSAEGFEMNGEWLVAKVF